MAPPLTPALLPEKVQLVTVAVPGVKAALKMAPPSPALLLLPEKVLLVTVSAASV